MCYKPYVTGSDCFPCRTCLECRQLRANEWALLCMFEAGEHLLNCYITLTYETSPLVLKRPHVQNFIKRLRKAITPIKIKYFACGEYGDVKRRPHFHILIFGYDFPDKYEIGKSPKGYPLYASEKLHNIWQGDESGETGGLVTLQDLTLNSAAYCALYSSPQKTHLPKYLQGHPEFNLMSQRLGVAAILRKYDEYYKTDEIWYDGRRHNIPQSVLDAKYKRKKRFTKAVYYLDWLYEMEEPERVVVGEHIDYWKLKKARTDKALRNEASILQIFRDKYGVGYTHTPAWNSIMTQKRYCKENAINRLTKTL